MALGPADSIFGERGCMTLGGLRVDMRKRIFFFGEGIVVDKNS